MCRRHLMANTTSCASESCDNEPSWPHNQSCRTCSPSSSNLSSDSMESSPPLTSFSSTTSSRSACDFILDIENFIPVGCVRVERYKCQITAEVWIYCNTWQWLAHPREIVTPNAGPFLQNTIQEVLFNSSPIAPYRQLHQAGWIRLEFKMRDTEWGQIRVYILPEDIGRRMIERSESSLRKSLQHLMAEVDTSKATWNAEWSEDIPVAHIDSGLDEMDPEVSLFYLFNTLPSPTPNLSVVHDPYAKDAMDRILNGNVEGLTTNMLAYQQRSAAMMLQKEAQPQQLVDPRLREVVDQHGNTWYCDPTTGTCLRTPRMYEAARGGICAETMGLGKTLICLALILATRDLSSQIPVEYSLGTIPIRTRVGSLLDMSAATIGRTGTPWRIYFNEQEQDGSDYSNCKDAIRRGAGHYYIPGPVPRRVSRNPIQIPPRKIYLSTTTLVVVPANLVRQWEREIEKHTIGLKVLVMKNNQVKLPSAVELAEYDIILFSRQRFEKESKDGSDDMGRRASTAGKPSDNFQADKVYHSPLRDLHFKRLITDEGHNMGNSNNASKTNAVVVVDFLQLSARWIVSGTPTQGLYGVDSMPDLVDTDIFDTGDMISAPSSQLSVTDDMLTVHDAEQERKDLEKLGNIATTYLKARPWANAKHDRDFASWSEYVMQPRHGSKSHGNLSCLRSTLEGMIIRHRPVDVEKDVELPPLHQKIVYLDGNIQDKLSLNLFSLVITSNAITSERKDADYLFHPRQRKALGQLVANLRQASFFWCGFTTSDVKSAVQHATSFLAKGEIFTSEEDKYLLQKAIEYGERALSNSIWLAASEHHEMPLYIQNDWASGVRSAWALDAKDNNPTLLGSTQLLALQKFVHTKLAKNQTMNGLEDAGKTARVMAQEAISSSPISRSKSSRVQRKADESLPALAGGLRVAEDLSPKKRQRKPSTIGSSSSARSPSKKRESVVNSASAYAASVQTETFDQLEAEQAEASGREKAPEQSSIPATPKASEFLPKSAKILSTASSKLSYLITQVLKYQKSEKIIIFYEADNVAYYIAQLLEAINVEHLIYAKSLSSDRRSRYIVTFNQSTQFRVLLMDISQAAFGLDVSSASRVYFINPVFNKQIEAQAVKRAHRIGQFRPVYVEILVLRDSIEEVIIERRKVMSSDEQKKCKSVLDDETMYDWIKNVRFVPLPQDNIPNPEQMAQLGKPQPVFSSRGRTAADVAMHDPDAGLVRDFTSPTSSSKKGKSGHAGKSLKRKVPTFDDDDDDDDDDDTELDSVIVARTPSKRQKNVSFLISDNEAEPEPSSTPSNNRRPYPSGPVSPARWFSLSGSPGSMGSGGREGSPASSSKAARSREQSPRELLERLRRGSGSPCPRSGSGSSSGSSSGSAALRE